MYTLITGGLGFIGSRLAAALVARGEEVYLLDNLSPQIHGNKPDFPWLESSQIRFLQGDITDTAALETALAGAKTVVHLAAETGTAQSMYQLAKYNRVNSQGTALLLDYLVNQPHQVKKVVLASSRSVYGEGAYLCQAHGMVTPHPRSFEALEQKQWNPTCPVCGGLIERMATPEEARVYPASIYAATKYAQEDLVRIACAAAGIGASILRFQNVYGAGQSLHNPYTGILSIFSTRIRQQKTIPIFEDGLESRDFVHVSDVVKAIMLALDSSASDGQILNVGSGVPSSVFEVANLLFTALNGLEISKPSISEQFRVGDIRHGYADIRRIQTVLGWQPEISLEVGIAEFAAWVEAQPLPEDRLDIALAELKAKRMGS